MGGYQEVPRTENRDQSTHTLTRGDSNIEDKMRINNTFHNGERPVRMMSVREILTDENGADALQAFSDDFNQRMMLIKKQLENTEHPINQVLQKFDEVIFKVYSKDIEKGIRNVKEMNGNFMPQVISSVQNWVRIIFFAVIRFYRLNLQPPENVYGDVRRDLLLNMITS